MAKQSMKKPVKKGKPASRKRETALAPPEIVDPRQISFIAGYTDPKSPTFSNALQSALAAGYSQSYAENILSLLPEWVSENIGNDRRIKKAEEHLDEVLDLPIITQAMGAFGPIFMKKERFEKVKLKNGTFKKKKIVEKVPVMVPNPSIIKYKNDMSKFALEALKKATYGKDRGPKIGFTFNLAGAKARYDS